MSLNLEYILRELIKNHKNKFVYQGKEISKDIVVSKTGALPILVKKTGLLHDFLFGEPLQVNYVSNTKAMTGEEVVILDKQHPFTLVMMLYDTLEELVVAAGDGDVVL